VRRDGKVRHMLVHFAVVRNAEGRITGFHGANQDITETIEAQEALRQSEGRLRALLQTIPDIIWLKDKQGVYLSCNTMFERFFGAKEADIVGKTDYDFVDRELADAFREHDRQAMAAGKPTSKEDWITFANDGHRALMETIKTPMFDAQGTLIGVLASGATSPSVRPGGRTPHRRPHRQAHGPAQPGVTDGPPATGGAAEPAAEGLPLCRAVPGPGPLQDHQRQPGTRCGDLMLQEISRRLHTAVRAGDSLSRSCPPHTTARLGGDEFVVLLDGLSRPGDAVIVAERLLEFWRSSIGWARTSCSRRRASAS